jgi:hypothetical protein
MNYNHSQSEDILPQTGVSFLRRAVLHGISVTLNLIAKILRLRILL